MSYLRTTRRAGDGVNVIISLPLNNLDPLAPSQHYPPVHQGWRPPSMYLVGRPEPPQSSARENKRWQKMSWSCALLLLSSAHNRYKNPPPFHFFFFCLRHSSSRFRKSCLGQEIQVA